MTVLLDACILLQKKLQIAYFSDIVLSTCKSFFCLLPSVYFVWVCVFFVFVFIILMAKIDVYKFISGKCKKDFIFICNISIVRYINM